MRRRAFAATFAFAAVLAPVAAQAALARGAKVTFERVVPAGEPQEAHATCARLLSLAVERGEVASPFLKPGLFRATWRTTVTLPVRDRYRFRLDGRGTASLAINGTAVLTGALRPGKPLETAEPVRMKKGENAIELAFESAAMGDGQIRLAWSGPDHGFEPIPPERLGYPADDADVAAGLRLERGLTLFGQRRCARCHEFEQQRVGESAFGELDVVGPDLRAVGARLQRDWMAAWLLDPQGVRPDATMPTFGFSEQEAADLATWLASLGAPAAAEVPAGAPGTGKDLFRRFGCIACHVPPDGDAKDAALGDRIPLHHVAGKWRPGPLAAYLQHPDTFHPDVRMPDFRLSLDEAAALAGWLVSVPARQFPESKGDAERGRKLAQKHHCGACHQVDLPVEERFAPRLRTLKAMRGCLAELAGARDGAPDHRLTRDDREALREFLPFATEAPFRAAPFDYARRNVAAQRCTSCHGFDGQPSVWARVAAGLSANAPLPKEHDPVAQGVPALTWTGGKLQPGWIRRFATGQEKSPRPWLAARMPTFHRRGDAIAQGLVREHGYGAADEPPVAPDAQMAIFGERLVQQGAGIGCVQCHALGDKPAVQVFEREGIELFLARRRLRHEYFTRWLADPVRLDPDSRMPKFANDKGRTGITDVLGGDAAQQFEAIWQFLASRN